MPPGRKKRPLQTYPQQVMRVTYESNLKEALVGLERAIKQKALRPAAYAGARVFYDEMRRVVPVWHGDLYESIYHWHNDKISTETKQVYDIGPNKIKAPHWHWIEYGNARIPAQPYVRPTWESQKKRAVVAMQNRLREKIDEILTQGAY